MYIYRSLLRLVEPSYNFCYSVNLLSNYCIYMYTGRELTVLVWKSLHHANSCINWNSGLKAEKQFTAIDPWAVHVKADFKC